MLLAFQLPGQSEALKTKRNRLLKELETTNQRLANTQLERGAAVGKASLLRSQIEQRRELIETLTEEIERNRTRMRRDSSVVIALNDDFERMKKEYGAALRAANRARLNQGWLSFLLSANGINDGFRRLTYLRQYRAYRSRQAIMIRRTRESLNSQLDRLYFQRIEQDSLLASTYNQGQTLAEELETQTELVSQLTDSERELLEKIRRQKRESEELNSRISRAIAENIRAEKESEAKKKETAAPEEVEEIVERSGIAAQRGKLLWPARGEIARHFGTQPHPDVPSVTIKNSGIDIQAGKSAPVNAIFAGEVISNREVPGFRNTLMVKHGKYYTVYSNLDRTDVKAGQEVKAGDRIGFTSPSGDALHFEIWRGRSPLNPESWLAK